MTTTNTTEEEKRMKTHNDKFKIGGNCNRLRDNFDDFPAVCTDGDIVTKYGIVSVSAYHHPIDGDAHTRMDFVAGGYHFMRTIQAFYKHRYISRLARAFAMECVMEVNQ